MVLPKIVWYHKTNIRTYYTKEEITELLKAIDTKSKHSKEDYLIISLICYLSLRINDVNFNENTINIIDSKRHISRLIVFSNSMKKCLEDYIELFDITDELLFKNYKDNKINNNSLREYYKKLLNLSNLNNNSHIHDLRHCFCNNLFNQMLEKSYNKNVVIIYPYKYMGHKAITKTGYYLHFTDYNKKVIILIVLDIQKNASL